MRKTSIFNFVLAVTFIGSGIGYAQPMEDVSARDVAKNLNQLIERSLDAQKGYEDAAKAVTSEQLKSEFTNESHKRKDFANKLQKQVTDLGQNYETKGSIEGAAHRGWIEVKTAVTNVNQDDAAVLGAVKTGESAALKAYEDALADGMPKDIDQVVKKQKDEIRKAYERVDEELEKIKRDGKI